MIYLIILILITLGAGWFGFNFLIRSRVIEDTPTSKIRSASQGYVELEGLTKAVDKEFLVAPLTHTKCLWYRYKIEKYQRNGKNSSWKEVESGTSKNYFSIDDYTGTCLINPEKADVTAARKQQWQGRHRIPEKQSTISTGALTNLLSFGSKYRYTEWRLHEDQFLYAIGLFQTIHAPSPLVRKQTEMKRLLNEWKQNHAQLIAKFDLNDDGKIDATEWEAARREAARQARYHVEKQPDDESVNILSYSPERRQPFMLSSIDPKSLTSRYKLKAFGCILGALIAGVLSIQMFISGNY